MNPSAMASPSSAMTEALTGFGAPAANRRQIESKRPIVTVPSQDMRPFPVSTADVDYVVIEMFGGDNNLDHFVTEDMNEMASGCRGRVVTIALADFARRPASVFEISAGTGVRTLEEWGEIDTGDPEILCQFLTRALITYPDARKSIGVWDHGSGVFDETDATELILARSMRSVGRAERTRSFPARRLFFPKDDLLVDRDTRAMLHDQTNGGVLTTLEAGKMLAAAFARAQQSRKVDMLFSDTCLNGMIEVLEELGDYAECFVASSELEPGDGWDYATWFASVEASRPADGAEWARTAVDAYREGYKDSSELCTLGAFRTRQTITDAFKALVVATEASGASGLYDLDRARAATQGFANRDTYDLIDFAGIVSENAQNDGVRSAAATLKAACEQARIHFISLGEAVSRSQGLAFWFPGSQSSLRRDIKTYRRLSFATKTGWAELLQNYR